jgi:hypothetical protein
MLRPWSTLGRCGRHSPMHEVWFRPPDLSFAKGKRDGVLQTRRVRSVWHVQPVSSRVMPHARICTHHRCVLVASKADSWAHAQLLWTHLAMTLAVGVCRSCKQFVVYRPSESRGRTELGHGVDVRVHACRALLGLDYVRACPTLVYRHVEDGSALLDVQVPSLLGREAGSSWKTSSLRGPPWGPT